tara:strand:- start:1942 stop:2214 length:273 start_codon:yes stop_codon:yes gene_type:complete
MYLRINQDYFLNNRDIGSLICVKSKNFYYNSLEEYENCIILELKYNLNYKKPTHMILLTSIGTERFVRLDYDKIIVEIKFLSRLKESFLK